jgi:hypothetical protein
MGVLLAAAGSLPLPALGDGPYWPTSLDVQVTPPEDYGTASLAAGPDGELYAALSRHYPSGSIGIEVLRSLDDGNTFESYGVFKDSNPEHNFAAPALVHLDNLPLLVLAMVEQVPGTGLAVRVARTPIGATPDWQMTTVGWGEDLNEPEIVRDPWAPERLYLIYRVLRVDQGFEIALDFARSTDMGASWSQPLEVGATVLPEEMTSAAVVAGPDSVVHVAWVATGMSGSSILHRRHLAAGNSGAFEPAAMIEGPGADVAAIELGAGSGPEVLALYLQGDGTLRSAWSPDAGGSFPMPRQVVVGEAETPDELSVISEGIYVHLVYRAFGFELRYRPLLLSDPSVSSPVSRVSDRGEPAAAAKVALRSEVGPAAVWFADTGFSRRPFLDASWFEESVSVSEDAPSAPPAAVIITAAPNPFRTTTAIGLQMADAAWRARVAVVAASGRRVALLHEGPLPAGRIRLTWDGRSSSGERLPAGVYYLEATLPGGSVRGRTVLLR